MADEVGRKNVDVILVRADVRIVGCESMKTFVPKRHGVDDAIGLGGGGQVFFSLASQFESETQNAIDSASREDCLLNGHLVSGALIQAPANVRVLSFVVLANDGEIDLTGLPIFQGRFDSVEKANGTKVHILPECASDGDEKSPKRYMIGNTGMADRAQKDGTEGGQLAQAILRHHFPGLHIGLATPVKGVPVHLKVEAPAGRLEHTHTFGYHFLSDPVSCDNCNVECFHRP